MQASLNGAALGSRPVTKENYDLPIATPVVHVVDDDPRTCELIGDLLSSAEAEIRAYASGEDFLERFEDMDAPQCLLLDVHLPGMSGLALQEKLASAGWGIPLVMVCGGATVPMAVHCMRAGAMDFLEKPLDAQALLSSLRQAIDRHRNRRTELRQQRHMESRRVLLSDREAEVMQLMVTGKNAKEIAARLGISVKTVATHRSRVLDKMAVDSTVELARLVWAGRA